MTQIFRVKINDVKVEVASANISSTLNQIYNTATFSIEKFIPPNSTVSIEYGDKIFEGFVYKCDRSNNLLYSVECRTAGGLLTSPFHFEHTQTIDPATTSQELFAYYSSEFGVPIISTAIDLSFGGDYERKGTPLQAIVTLANVTGAEFWWDGSAIRIEPAKYIEESGTEILPKDIFNFVPVSKGIDQKGIGSVIVGQTNENLEVISTSIKCSASVDGCSTIATILTSPHDSFTGAENIELREVDLKMDFEQIVASTLSLAVDAHIVSIAMVKVDGVLVTDYSFLYDTILFTAPKAGKIKVQYTGHARVGYAKVKADENDRYTNFNIYYGECEMLAFSTTLSCDGNGGGDGDDDSIPDGGGGDGISRGYCGDTYVTMPANPNYASGFVFYMVGGDQNLAFYTDTERLNYMPTIVTAPIPQIEKGVLNDNGDGTFSATLKQVPDSVTGMTANGEYISGYWVGDTVTFDEHYHGVLIAYEIEGTTAQVKFDNMFNESVKMMVSDENGECEYSLEGYNANKVETNSCEIGIDVKVNVLANLEGVTIMDASGKTVYITPPVGSEISRTVDSQGNFVIANTMEGTYTIDMKNIKKNSKIFLKVQV